MSNASLKEQLQTLGLSIEASEVKPSKKKGSPPPSAAASSKPHKAQQQKKVNVTKPQKPAWLEQAQYGVELLKAHFPLCFKDMKEVQPLKIGIKQDLVKALSTHEEIVISDKACMVNSLSYYVNAPAYHKRIVEGTTRVDLQGNPAGIVTADEAKYSLDCKAAKFQKKQLHAVKKKNEVLANQEISSE
jgi:ProP effector